MMLQPSNSNTEVLSGSVWKPKDFGDVLEELSNLEAYSVSENQLLLYRGQRERRWLLDSTFVRSFKTTLFGIEPHLRLTKRITDSAEFHPAILNLYLLKFGVLARPSEELEAKAKELSLDSWFEFMKRIQQYPEEDGFFLKGTNLLDWSLSFDVGLYFANSSRTGEGAIFVCNATATGNTLQKIPVGEILDRMAVVGKTQALGPPLLFSPERQILNARPKNQQVVYVAQMDLRYDLEQIWRSCEEDYGRSILVKIILPQNSIEPIADYLASKGVNDDFIFPDKVSAGA